MAWIERQPSLPGKEGGWPFGFHAVGTITNATTRQRFGVKVELDVLDERGNKTGSATDYTEVIEPGKEWKFRAMVTDKSATAAKLASVKEQE